MRNLKNYSFRPHKGHSDSMSKDCSCYSVADLLNITRNNQQLPSLKHYSYSSSPIDLDKKSIDPSHLGELKLLEDSHKDVVDVMTNKVAELKDKDSQRLIDEEVQRRVASQIETLKNAQNVSQSVND